MLYTLDCNRHGHVLPKTKDLYTYFPSEHLHGLNRFLRWLKMLENIHYIHARNK
jgi:hypothetical protein